MVEAKCGSFLESEVSARVRTRDGASQCVAKGGRVEESTDGEIELMICTG